MRVRWFLVFVVLYLSLPLLAQEEHTLYIYAEINPPGRTGSHSFQPGESHFTPLFFEKLRDNLRADGVHPVFVTSPEADSRYPDFFEDAADYPTLFEPEEHTLSLTLLTFFDQDSVYLSPFAAYQFEPLPMGSFGYVAIATMTPERPESVDLAAELAAGMALYIGRECEKALPHLETVKQNAVFIKDGFFLYGNVRFYMGSCEYVLNHPDTAVALYTDAIAYEDEQARGTSAADARIFTDNPNTNLAWLLVEAGELDSARKLLDDYRGIDYPFTSHDIERFLERADLYIRIGAETAALDELNAVIDHALTEVQADSDRFLDDELARLYAERGWRAARIGNRGAALTDFQTAIDTDPAYPKVYFWRGLIRYLMADFAAAQDDLEQFIALAPDYDNYYEDNLTPFMAQAAAILDDIEAGLCLVR